MEREEVRRGIENGALRVRYRYTSSVDVEEVVEQFKKMGLREGEHFTVKRPGEGVAYLS